MNILIKYDNKKLFELIKYYLESKHNYNIYFCNEDNLNFDMIISINSKVIDKNTININCSKVILNNSEYFNLLIKDLLKNKFKPKRYRLNSFLFFVDFLTGLEMIILKGKKGEIYKLYPSKKDQMNDNKFLDLIKKRIKKLLGIDILYKIESKIYTVNDRKNNIKLIKLGWRQFFSIEMIIDNYLRLNYLNKNINNTFNLVFSVITNKKVLNVLSFISNVIKFNKKNNILILLHLDEKNYKIKKIYENSYVKVNNIYYDKMKGTTLELLPIIDNFNYLEKMHINYNNYIYLSSNSRFIKQNKKIQNYELEYKLIKTKQDISKLRKWHWKRFKKNKEIVRIFKDLQIELTGFNLSGVIFDYKLMRDIVLFINKYKLLEQVVDGYGIIEILIPSLSKYFLGYKLKSILKIYFNRKKYIPKIEDIKKELNNDNIYIVKTIPDNFNNKVYKFIQNLS